MSARQEGLPPLLIGHGSGSYGHTAGKRFHTRIGVSSPQEWQGFSQVWRAARQLNQVVIDELASAGLDVIAFPPSACASASGRQVQAWNTAPIRKALDAGLVPVVNGDVVFDAQLGGTIVSTEEVFTYLAPVLHPDRVLIAGSETGVWADFPFCTRLIERITPRDLPGLLDSLHGSAAVDTTGGMLEKVTAMVGLVEHNPAVEASIFSGLEPGALLRALKGEQAGTLISANPAPARSRS